MTPKVISAGFKRDGICPFNLNVIDYCVSTSSEESAIPTDATSSQPAAASSEESMVLTDATSSQHPAVSSEDILAPADAITSQLPANFSLEQEQLFQKRFEEKYDLPDPAYQQWLTINHPATLRLEDQPNEVDSFAKKATGYSSEQEFEDYDLMDSADQPWLEFDSSLLQEDQMTEFSPEQELLFQRRYEENFDIPDPVY